MIKEVAPTTKSLTEMAVEIATAQAGHSKMSAEEIDRFLQVTFERLRKMKQLEEGTLEEPAEEQKIPADPLQSIQRAKVICLECGREFRQLTNAHLKSHGLTSREYKKKWGLPLKQPLAAKNLIARRRRLAREMNLADRLRQVREARKKK